MPAAHQTSQQSGSDPAQWVALHGDALFRFARLRLGQADLAEDAVQETLLAALAARGRFAGEASERTWLIGILRNKIVDTIRRQQRNARHSATQGEAENAFEDGLWRTRPGIWNDPTVAHASAAEFRTVVSRCIEKLPSPQREALCLCELDGMAAAAVGELLGVSTNNVWTLVHRAKLQLRDQLEQDWFEVS